MRRTLLMLSLLTTAAQAQQRPAVTPCHPTAEAAVAREPARVRPLREMPPAKQLLGVYREVGGCTSPVVLRERVGTSPRDR